MVIGRMVNQQVALRCETAPRRKGNLARNGHRGNRKRCQGGRAYKGTCVLNGHLTYIIVPLVFRKMTDTSMPNVITLHHITSHHIASHYTTVHCITLHYIATLLDGDLRTNERQLAHGCRGLSVIAGLCPPVSVGPHLLAFGCACL